MRIKYFVPLLFCLLLSNLTSLSRGIFYDGINTGDKMVYETTPISDQNLRANITFLSYNTSFYNASVIITAENGSVVNITTFLENILSSFPLNISALFENMTDFTQFTDSVINSSMMPTGGLLVLEQETIESLEWNGISLTTWQELNIFDQPYWYGRYVIGLDVNDPFFQSLNMQYGFHLNDWFVIKWDNETGIFLELTLNLNTILSDIEHLIISMGVPEGFNMSDWYDIKNYIYDTFGSQFTIELVDYIGILGSNFEEAKNAPQVWFYTYWWIILLIIATGVIVLIMAWKALKSSHENRFKQENTAESDAMKYCNNMKTKLEIDACKDRYKEYLAIKKR